MIDIKDKERILFLKERIRKDYATINEYKEYEKLLFKYGMTQEDIDKYMKKENLTGYDELIDKRKKNIKIEHVVVAGLLGLGLAAIFNTIFNKKD